MKLEVPFAKTNQWGQSKLIITNLLKCRAICLAQAFLMLLFSVDLIAEESVKPLLSELLVADKSLKKDHKKILKIVLENYLPVCPRSRFKFSSIGQAFQISESSGPKTYDVVSNVVCDDERSNPHLIYSGEIFTFDSHFSLRSRGPLYTPTAEAQTIIDEGRRKRKLKEDAKPKPPPEPTHKDYLDKLKVALKADKSISNAKRAAYQTVIQKGIPECSESPLPKIRSIKDAIWLSKFNEGFVAVALNSCDWNGAWAYRLSSTGKILIKFRLPLGKYGFSPAPVIRVGDYTGDGKQELYYHKIFPISSVSAFSKEAMIYKFKRPFKPPARIFAEDIEIQNCHESSRSDTIEGDRELAGLEFLKTNGKITVTKRIQKMNCQDFSWGKTPVRVLRTISTEKYELHWKPQVFKFVRELQ